MHDEFLLGTNYVMQFQFSPELVDSFVVYGSLFGIFLDSGALLNK